MIKALLAGIMAVGFIGTATAQQAPRILGKNTKVEATTEEQISSGKHKIGDMISATINNDVKDEDGNIIFAAGSQAKLKIIDIKSADDTDKDGVLALQVSQVTSNGQTYTLNAPVDSVAKTTQKPGWTSDKKKMGIGAAAGAVVGGLATGNLKGALAGGVLGAIGGAVVTHELSGKDVIVKSGTTLDFTLTEPVRVLVS